MDRFKVRAALAVAATSACGLLSAEVASATDYSALAAGEANVCIATNGEVRVQRGTATCVANGTGSVAIARGENSVAFATGGDGNQARAIGENSSALAASATTTRRGRWATTALPSRSRRQQHRHRDRRWQHCLCAPATTTLPPRAPVAVPLHSSATTTPRPRAPLTAPPVGSRRRKQHRHRERR